MKKLFTLSLSFVGVLLFGQFSTSGTGQTYTIAQLDDLTDAISFDASSNQYLLSQDLKISATDTFISSTGYTLAIADNVLITIEGNIRIDSPETVHFTSVNPGNVYFQGLRLNDGSSAYFNNFKMTYGGGIRALSGDFFMNDSEVSYQNSGTSTGGAINFSEGNPTIQNSVFRFNATPAVASGANQSVALNYLNNYLEANNQDDSNRPQINMGPSGSANPTVIKNNLIKGDRTKTRVGGISVSSLLGVSNHVLIENNTIIDNRYGITISGGNSYGNIIGNTIRNNNTETIPDNGGSGINIYLASNPADYVINIFDNIIDGNLWGITNIGNGAFINLGTADRLGNNVFENNINGGINYAFYNNSAINISAQGNCWDPILSPENVIVHQIDNPNLGLVDYSNAQCNLGVNDVENKKITLYPNPNKGEFFIDTETKDQYQIYDLTGKLLMSGELNKGKNTLKTYLRNGVYVLKTLTSTIKVVIH